MYFYRIHLDIIVDDAFGDDVNIPKFRILKELVNIDLYLFNNMSLIEGISGERFHYLLKMIFKLHNNRQNEKQYKSIYKRFQIFIALCYAMAGGRWGPFLKHKLGSKCRKMKNLHDGHESEPSPLIEEFIFPDITQQNSRIFPSRVTQLDEDFDSNVLRNDPLLRQQFTQEFGNSTMLNTCHINQVRSFYLNDRYKSTLFQTNEPWNWVLLRSDNSENDIRRYARVKHVYEFIFNDPNNPTSTIKKVFWNGDIVVANETYCATEQQFNDYSSKSFDCLDKVNVDDDSVQTVWMRLENIDSAVILLHECSKQVHGRRGNDASNYLKTMRNFLRNAILNHADPSTVPCGVKLTSPHLSSYLLKDIKRKNKHKNSICLYCDAS